jgi:hypothetical protein
MSDFIEPTPGDAEPGQGDIVPVDDGQDDVIAPAAGGQGDQPFYAVDDYSFATKEELDKAMRESFMMQSSFTKKSQAHAQEKANWEKQRDAEDVRLKALRDEYQQFQRLIDERPDVYREMQQRLAQGPSPSSQMAAMKALFEKEYGPQMAEFKSWKAQQETLRERDDAFTQLAGKYKDFDSEAVNKAFEELTQAGILELAEMLYFSLKGKVDPVEMQKRISDDLARKKGAGLIPPAPASKKDAKIPDSFDQAEHEALMAVGAR